MPTSNRLAAHGDGLAQSRDESPRNAGKSEWSVSSRKFLLERDMTFPARNWLQFAGFTTKDEFRTPWGICDLVGVKLSNRYIEDRLSLSQSRPVGNARQVALLESIPGDDGISISELALTTSTLFSVDELQKELRHLQAGHFVSSREGGLYTRQIPESAGGNLIVAVEIKLDKIEEVLFQARANLAFAHRSYIGMPTANAERLARSERSKELCLSGVGLLSVERGRCEELIGSAGDDSLSNPSVRAHCIERFWRTLTGNTA